MIDLRKKDLPNAILAEGRSFLIQTDFRVWLSFELWIKTKDANAILENVFIENPVFITQEILEGLKSFYITETPCPHGDGGDVNSDELFDVDIDSDYLVGAFWQAYNIDLTTVDMHWHLYQALLVALPEETKLAKAIAYRSYSGSDKDYNKLKSAWSLPAKIGSEEKETLNEFDKIF